MKKLYSIFLILIVACATTAEEKLEVPAKNSVEVRKSDIPGAGMGVFAVKDIPEGTLIGPYHGKKITKEKAWELYQKKQHHYFFHVPECSGHKDTPYMDGDREHYISKVNFAPKKINDTDTNLQNVHFKKFCDEPYIRLYASRDISAGEELYVSYGDEYEYDFMNYKEVQDFFMKKTGIKKKETFSFKP